LSALSQKRKHRPGQKSDACPLLSESGQTRAWLWLAYAASRDEAIAKFQAASENNIFAQNSGLEIKTIRQCEIAPEEATRRCMRMQPLQTNQTGAVKCVKDSARYQEAQIGWRQY
jgi:hypothetical protein